MTKMKLFTYVTENNIGEIEYEDIDNIMFARKCLNCDRIIISRSTRRVCKKCAVELLSTLL